MKIEYIKLVDLKPADYNPRKISDKEMKDLQRDLKEFGFVEPIVINKDTTIIGGHQRVKAAKEIGMKEVPAFRVDLDDEKARTLNIALNKIQGEWDYTKLQDVLVDLPVDMQTLAGFSSKEMEKLTALFQEDDFNLDDTDFEKEVKNHEFRILLPKDFEETEEIKKVLSALKGSFPDIVIKEVM